MSIDYKKYLFNNTTQVRTAQKKFDLLCEDIATGKYNEPISDSQGNIIPGEITNQRFKMAYGIIDKDDPFCHCREQLPKYYFVSEDGYIITLADKGKGNLKPKWYRGNKQNGARNDNERIVKITSPTIGKFYRKSSKGKTTPVTIANYAIVAIMYGSILIADQEIKNNLKKYGLEVFGAKNSGHLSDEEKKESGVKGEKGLIIDGVEVIKAKDMLETHHVEGSSIIDSNLLEIMPRWLHDYLKYYTANCESKEEVENLIKKDKVCLKKLSELLPEGYFIEDHSKKILEDGSADKYIHYDGINKERENQVEAKYYKYFKIIPEKYSDEDRINIIKQFQMQNDQAEALSRLENDDGVQSEYPIDFYRGKEIKRFYVIYNGGDKELFKKWINRITYDLKKRNQIGEQVYKTYEEKGISLKERTVKGTDLKVLTYININKT